MGNNAIEETIAGFFSKPLIEYPNKSAELKSKAAFGFLLILFLIIGFGIIYGFFEKKDASVVQLLFGIFICIFPFLLYLLVNKFKSRMITKVDREGIEVKSSKIYAWKDLQRITYHLAMKKFAYNTPDQCYMMDLFFTNGTARASYIMQTFPIILLISKALPVPKKEKINAYRK